MRLLSLVALVLLSGLLTGCGKILEVLRATETAQICRLQASALNSLSLRSSNFNSEKSILRDFC